MPDMRRVVRRRGGDFPVELNVHIENDCCGGSSRSRRPKYIAELLHSMEKIMGVLDELRAEVAQNTSVSQSAMLLLDGLAAKINDMVGQPGGVQEADLVALRDEIRANRTALADAVVRNTDELTGEDTDAGGEDTTAGGEDTDVGGEDTGPGGDTLSGDGTIGG